MITIKINDDVFKELYEKYKNYSIDVASEYILFTAKYQNTIITIYKDKTNSPSKCTFSGNYEAEFANEFSQFIVEKKKKAPVVTSYFNTDEQIGSDEVGFGDFFGPIVVTAAYCDKETLILINQLGIKDSKKITDEQIRVIVPKLKDKVVFSTLVVENTKLTELFDKGYNLNKIKSILHNAVLLKVREKIGKNTNAYIDEFAKEELYYSYLQNEKQVLKGITFETKGESKYPSIALASCIARHTFLTRIDQLNAKYHVNIPLGASSKVDLFAKEFANKYGLDEIKSIIKTNFVNYKKLI
ncbi:MAG: ribonuclease HIII [Bacilli bacterium]